MIGLVLAGTFTSCSDFLDADNKTNPEDAEAYFAKHPEELLYTSNDRLKTLVNRTDIFIQGTDLYKNVRGKNPGDFNTYSTLSAQNSEVFSFYKAAYDMINNANGAILYSEENSKTAHEAMFNRAYGYYLLTQHFGSVPYVTTYTLSSDRNFPRTPLEEVYGNMIADLTLLAGNDSKLAAVDHTGHPSKKAAQALLAKVYLAAGWDLDVTINNEANGTYTVNSTERFQQAAKYAEEAISGIPLTMSFEDKWSQDKEGNAEEIFSVQYDRTSWPGDQASSGHSFQNNFGNYYGNVGVQGEKQVGSENARSEKSTFLFEEGDTRYEATFMTTFYNYNGTWGTSGYYAFYNCTAAELATKPIFLKFYPYWMTTEQVKADLAAHKSQFVVGSCKNTPQAALMGSTVQMFEFDNSGNAGEPKSFSLDAFNDMQNGDLCVRKFDDKNSEALGSKNDYRDIVLLHASDIYLVAAEAYFMAGQTANANTKLNAVRTRAGVASVDLANPTSYRTNNVFYNVPSSFGAFTGIDIILDERAREMYAENNRWEDLKRTKQLVRYNIAFNNSVSSISDMSNNSGEVKWLRPIPADEIAANPGITEQNAGY